MEGRVETGVSWVIVLIVMLQAYHVDQAIGTAKRVMLPPSTSGHDQQWGKGWTCAVRARFFAQKKVDLQKACFRR